jgi:mono/diheme cytochrome c family protein
MKRLLALLFVITACGAPQPQAVDNPAPAPQPTPGPNPNPGGKTSFAETQRIMQTYCVECHASAAFTKSEQALIASSSKSRVQNSTMPPPYATQLPAGEKAKFLNFF